MLIYSDSQNRTCTDCRLNYYGVYYYFGVKTRGVWLRGQGIMNVVVEKSVCSFINGDLIAVKSYSNEILLMINILQRFSVKMKRIFVYAWSQV